MRVTHAPVRSNVSIIEGPWMILSNSNFRYTLLLFVVCTIVLNLGLGSIAYDLSLDSQPERLNNLAIKIESGEIEITKNLVLSQISSFKKFAQASDNLAVGLQQLIALITIMNIIVVLLMVTWLLHYYKKYQSL